MNFLKEKKVFTGLVLVILSAVIIFILCIANAKSNMNIFGQYDLTFAVIIYWIFGIFSFIDIFSAILKSVKTAKPLKMQGVTIVIFVIACVIVKATLNNSFLDSVTNVAVYRITLTYSQCAWLTIPLSIIGAILTAPKVKTNKKESI